MVTLGRNPSVQNLAYITLRESIINLNLTPGTAVSEKDMAARFKVSRTPVREAFINLAKEGLVEVIPQKGTRISLINPMRAEEEFFIRKHLEIGALSLFVQKCKEEHFACLEKLLEYQETALTRKAYSDFIKYDDRLHQVFFEVSGQNLGWEVIVNNSGHYHRIRMLVVRISGIADEKIQQHRSMITALKRKDLKTTIKILNSHLLSLLSEEKILKEKFPDFFLPDKQENSFEVDFGGLPRI
jgi:DNA-binding GntR family transcriptional regulator